MVMRDFSVIVQARVNSKRLPGKIFYKIGKSNILQILIYRLKKSKKVKKIIFATSTKLADNKIVNFCKKNNIDYFRGPEKNVALRYLLTAKKFNVKNIIRITSDCPLVDASLIDKMIKIFKKKNVNYLSNTNPPTFPDGFDIEIFKTKAFEKKFKKKLLPYHKEHVTTYLRKYEKKNYNFKNPEDLSRVRLTLDYKKDLNFLRNLFNNYKNIKNYNYIKLLKIIKSNPKFFNLNEK